MGASRRLQVEIDRVLRKVQEGVDVFDSIWKKFYDTDNANRRDKFMADLRKEIKKLQRYRDQIKTWIQSSEIKDKKALMDARKQIERMMERFKVCEKETKTKATKTDPKEKAKAETRDWLNIVVSDLECQIDNFEAEFELLSIKKGNLRPPRMAHLEKSVTRHKAHIKKLESILRLLDNDELSPQQVYDVKDFLDDYVERNQEDFDEFSDVEDLYSTLPMEKVEIEALEDMVSVAPYSPVKGVDSVLTTAVLSTKSSVATSPTQTIELNILERILVGSEEPRNIDLLLLRSITGNFSEMRKIGVGGCGEVYKGTLRNGDVAVKRLFSVRTIKDKMFHREVKSLITVRHQNIVRFLGYCSFTEELALPFEGRTIMVEIRERLLCFEYISNGNLENHLTDELRGLEWHTRYEIIVGICKGLLYLHKEKDIVHMDLKPANILLDDLMVPKITDFGLSRLDNNSQGATTSRLMSPGYSAPEYVFEGKSSSKSDIYSLGVMVIELVTGNKKEPDLTKVLRRWRHRWIESSKHTPLGYQQVTKCLELAQRCIQIDPRSRPDIADIMQELNAMNYDQFQEIPCMEDIIGIKPLEICFPFEFDPQTSHSIELTNDTDDYIAFMTEARLLCFHIEPNKGIVQPRSKCSVTVTMQAQVNALPNNRYKEVTVLSTKVDGGLAAMDITRDVFIEKEGTVVDEVNVMVVFEKPPPGNEES